MKKKLFYNLFLAALVSIVFFSFKEKNNTTYPLPTPTVFGNEFIIGIMENGGDGNYSHLEDLNLNLWHKYGGWKNSFVNWWVGDSLNADFNNYGSNIHSII